MRAVYTDVGDEVVGGVRRRVVPAVASCPPRSRHLARRLLRSGEGLYDRRRPPPAAEDGRRPGNGPASAVAGRARRGTGRRAVAAVLPLVAPPRRRQLRRRCHVRRLVRQDDSYDRSVMAAFHDADTDILTDILARIVA